MLPTFRRVPRHVAIIPDGNRRWAAQRGLPKEEGYLPGLRPGLELYEEGRRLGIEEVSVYGFTTDNTKRPRAQVAAFQAATVAFAEQMRALGAPLQAIGDDGSPLFPRALAPLRARPERKPGWPKINLLVNYGWRWDLDTGMRAAIAGEASSWSEGLGSRDVSRIDLVIRWGGRNRLSGMLPIQAVYADLFVVDALWPDFQLGQFHAALRWYQEQDVTLGG
jgi:undecaprenyl diphosphate synthase